MRLPPAVLLVLLPACAPAVPAGTVTGRAPGPPSCLAAEGRGAEPTRAELRDDGEGGAVASVVVEPARGCLRSYLLETTQGLRDGVPANPRRLTEVEPGPRVRTRNPLFDALHALAMEEARECAVGEIRDEAFEEGRALACPEGGCFETGRLWTYVWTRDTSYATHLGLAALDPLRASNSLELKLSERRGGGDLQVVQDTGSGGSWPVSTDRVVWALGARELSLWLHGEARARFRARALEALANTVEVDRLVVFDEAAGLYRGEQSFLDWREQSYPPWTAEDTAPISASLALSTNVGHLAALELVAELAREAGRDEDGGRYAAWARELREAIHARLWLAEAGLWSTFVPGPLDPGPARRFDLLGTALAVLHDVGDRQAARLAVSRYPHLRAGAPVLWPQQPEPPIYHNRAIWPFVTAYFVRAARRVGNGAAVDHGLRSLMRASALNLSNMENLEMVTGAPHLEDAERSGPVVNSQRQLWSVAGYLSTVHHVIFGLEAAPEGLGVAPFVTEAMRRDLFGRAESLVLEGFPFRGAPVTVVVRLPPLRERAATGGGRVLEVLSVRVSGEEAPSGLVPAAALARGGLVEVELGEPTRPGAGITTVEALDDPEALFGPRAPELGPIEVVPGGLRVPFAVPGEDPERLTVRIYRDGAPVSGELSGAARSWLDSGRDRAGPRACYAAEARYPSSGNVSARSAPACFFGRDGRTALGLEPPEREGERLSATFRARSAGAHLVRLLAANGAGPVNTGVTCAVRRLDIVDQLSGRVVSSGFVAIPQAGLGAWDRFLPTAPVRFELEAGREYRVRIARDGRAPNMSAFAHFERYTGGLGGADGPVDRAEIDAVEVLAPAAEARGAGGAL